MSETAKNMDAGAPSLVAGPDATIETGSPGNNTQPLEAQPMLDVRIPHVHAPHGELGGWRGFITHIAVVAIGLLLALGLEQGVEYVHHEIQRGKLETQMLETFRSNLKRIDNNVRVLSDLRAYLFELRNAVNSKIAGETYSVPSFADSRNYVYAPPPNLGSYEASKNNGSVSLLGLNRVRLYDRIEFQYNMMVASWREFIGALSDARAFADRYSEKDEYTFGKLAQPNIDRLSKTELLEYQALLAKLIQYDRQYAAQLINLKSSSSLMLRGVDDLDTLLDSLNPRQAAPHPVPAQPVGGKISQSRSLAGQRN